MMEEKVWNLLESLESREVEEPRKELVVEEVLNWAQEANDPYVLACLVEIIPREFLDARKFSEILRIAEKIKVTEPYEELMLRKHLVKFLTKGDTWTTWRNIIEILRSPETNKRILVVLLRSLRNRNLLKDQVRETIKTLMERYPKEGAEVRREIRETVKAMASLEEFPYIITLIPKATDEVLKTELIEMAERIILKEINDLEAIKKLQRGLSLI
jgi:hypothetical protein